MAKSKSMNLVRRAFAEGAGTFLFTFIGAAGIISAQFISAGSIALALAALANGLGLAIAVSSVMNISGGHLNPAITIAAALNRLMPGRDALAYIAAQLGGAILAGLLLVLIYPTAAAAAVNYGAPSLGPSVTQMQGIFLEAVMTFVLAFVIMGTAVDRRAPKIAGFAIGIAVMVDVLAGGPFTGAAMNPARAIGPALASGFLTNWYVYWIGPVIGAVAAMFLYKRMLMDR